MSLWGIPYLKCDRHSLLCFKDSWLMASNPYSDIFVLIIKLANWKVHAEDVESFSCVSGKIVRDNFSYFLFWSLMLIFQKEAAVGRKLVCFVF